MSRVDIVGTEAFHIDGVALIERDGSVWRTHSRPWWDLASHAWWFLMPGVKKWVIVRDASGRRFRLRAVRISKFHISIGASR